MNKTRLDLLEKQSKTNKDFNDIIDLIAPIVIDKKITKRETDKANALILEKFGTYNAGDDKKYPRYSVAVGKNYSITLDIYAHDRYIQDSSGCSYIPNSVKSIYLHNDKTLTIEDLQRYKNNAEGTPSRQEIEKSFDKYEKLNEKIKDLEDQRNELVFHYYFK